MRQMRCKTHELAIYGRDFGRRIGHGAVVDFDEALAPGITLADAVEGREDCFEPVDVAPATQETDTDEHAAVPQDEE